MKHYLSNCWLWLRGFVWLWTRDITGVEPDRSSTFIVGGRYVWAYRPRHGAPIMRPAVECITYKTGWSPLTFLPVYLLNVGTHVLLSGGAVTSWSRAAWDLRQSGNRWGRLLDKAIQAILGDDHGKQSGAVLWGSTPCEPKVRWAVAIGWTAFFVWVFA